MSEQNAWRVDDILVTVLLISFLALFSAAVGFGSYRVIISDTGASDDNMVSLVFEGEIEGYDVKYYENRQPLYGKARNEMIIGGVKTSSGKGVKLLLQDQIGWRKIEPGKLEPDYLNDTLELVVVRGESDDIRISSDFNPNSEEYQTFQTGQQFYTEFREAIRARLLSEELPKP